MKSNGLHISARQDFIRRGGELIGRSLLFSVASVSAVAVLFIFYFIAKDAFPFFNQEGYGEFFTSPNWYPTGHPPEFGALAIFFGSALVTTGAVVFSVPLGVAAAMCLSDILPFWMRQIFKPTIEILAAIPSVAYGFFALVVFAPLLQENGGFALATGIWIVGLPVATIGVVVMSDVITSMLPFRSKPAALTLGLALLLEAGVILTLFKTSSALYGMEISSGTNALNVSIILGIMALPTIVSVSEDALQSVGRELREGSYALGATRAETIIKVVLPASISGILAAVILGIMRAIGETMVVWMASGNAARIPTPFYNLLQPVRTLTATIAGDMGEADHVTGSSRYHVLFAMAFCLLLFSFAMNLITEAFTRRYRKKLGK
ncbi:MAG: phosphate ABC transporter permease subunit PstC [Victivallales bacterium]|nr:phosphate ABC transporter permease subunit PstC [Victivallales bacterium]